MQSTLPRALVGIAVAVGLLAGGTSASHAAKPTDDDDGPSAAASRHRPAGVVAGASGVDGGRQDSLQVAVTFDDVPLGGADVGLERLRAATLKLVTAIREAAVPAVGFVNESKLFVEPGEVEDRTTLLQAWLDAGLELGNHTYSHPSITTTPLDEYQDDVVRGERVTGRLLRGRGRDIRFFRHPFLRTGATLEVKRAFEAFLQQRGYTVAPVTAENWDYVYAAIYARALGSGDRSLMERVGREYVGFTARCLEYYEGVSEEVLGRQVRHVLLLHANELNADYLDDLVELMRTRGYEFIPLEEALEDPAYDRPDEYAGNAGVSWLFRWDYTANDGQPRANWRAEPAPPDEIMRLFEEGR